MSVPSLTDCDHSVNDHSNIVFVVNALAMIRLAGLLGFGTESVAHHCGDAVGALLNASFG